MDLRHLIFLVLFTASAGTIITSGFLRQDRVGNRYFLYHGGIFLALVVLGLFILPTGVLPTRGHTAIWTFLISGLVFNLTAVRSRGVSYGGWAVMVLSTLYLFAVDLPVLKSQSPLWPFAVNQTLSVLFLGVTMTAMLLGHWYLNQPKLPIEELMRFVYAYLVLAALRFLWGTGYLFLEIRDKSEAEIYRFFLSSTPGLFSLMRWAWGLLAPLALAYWIYGTAKIRSTQSATGILYVAVTCVLIGEILSHYLAFFHGLPL